MARIYPLFSSSKGNCIYFGDQTGGIIVDCGVSCRRICDALENNGLPLSAVKAIFITHTHSDHVSGLKVFLRKVSVPLYAQQLNLDILSREDKLPENTEQCAIADVPVEVGGFTVSCFPTHHDTPESCGYRIRYPDGKTAVLCTDLGEITDEVKNGTCGAELVMLESNYDEQMLKNGSYPYELKQRIASDHGHLSNEQCGNMLAWLAANGTSHFVLGHLSEENNTPQTARNSAVSALFPLEHTQDYLLYIAAPQGGKAIVF